MDFQRAPSAPPERWPVPGLSQVPRRVFYRRGENGTIVSKAVAVDHSIDGSFLRGWADNISLNLSFRSFGKKFAAGGPLPRHCIQTARTGGEIAMSTCRLGFLAIV